MLGTPLGSDAAHPLVGPGSSTLVDGGWALVLDMGDQQSDLDGGRAERTFKLPNPVYFPP